MLRLQERHPRNLEMQSIDKKHQIRIANVQGLDPRRQRRRADPQRLVVEVGRDAGLGFLLARHGVEFGALVFHDGHVFGRDGAEDEEWVRRGVPWPGRVGAGIGGGGEELLEAVLESVEVVAEDEAGAAAGCEVVAEIYGCVDGGGVGEFDHEFWSEGC